MKKNIQSRRDFFKHAVNNVLPILGTVFLANMPIDSSALSGEIMGCAKNSCYRMCMNDCQTSCDDVCVGACRVTCRFMCGNTCGGSCKNTCNNIAKILQKNK